MKKKILLTITIASIFCCSSLSSANFSYLNIENALLLEEENLFYKVSLPELTDLKIIDEENGHRLEIKDFNYLSIPGKPMLPVKTILFALPPGRENVLSPLSFTRSTLPSLITTAVPRILGRFFSGGTFNFPLSIVHHMVDSLYLYRFFRVSQKDLCNFRQFQGHNT